MIALPEPLPASLLPGVNSLVAHGLRWREWFGWIGRGCLFAFAMVALVSANRGAGLLTAGSVGVISSALRGTVRVGVAYLLVPVGAVSWFAARFSRLALERAEARQPAGRWFGPIVVSGPIAILIALSIARLSPTIGWGDAAFVVVGLALLALTYLFVLTEQLAGRALAAMVTGICGLQASVGLGQFILQRDLGLAWLGELRLDPSASGISVIGSDPTRILRAYGLMRHPNALGAILPLGLLAAISLWTRGQTRWRYFWLALAVLITAGLVVSFSRAGWLGAAAGIVVLVIASQSAQKSPSGHNWSRRAVPALLAACLVVAIGAGLRPDLFLARIDGGLTGASSLEHWSLANRARDLRRAVDLIQRWPMWGVGTRRYVIATAEVSGDTAQESLLVNSTPLVLWAENGVAAPVAWLGLGLVVVWLGCRRPSTAMLDPDLALATSWFAAIQVVCLFQAFFWPTHELWQGGIWLGIVLGLWACAWASASSRSRPPGSSGPSEGRADTPALSGNMA